MPEMAQYRVDINGIEHTMQLSPGDADRYGDAATKVVARKAAAPANKAADPANKAAAPDAK